MFYASLIPAETRPSSQGLLPADPTANTLLDPGPHSSSLFPATATTDWHLKSRRPGLEGCAAARANCLQIEIEKTVAETTDFLPVVGKKKKKAG